jgi:hypothetical protein
MARKQFPYFNVSDIVAALVGGITATELNTGAVTTVKIADANVTLAKLATGIVPSHVAKYAGTITWSGSGAALDTTIAGVAATDHVSCTFRVAPTQAAYIASAIPSAGHLVITLSAANTGNQAQIDYVVFRAAA